jgi:outer membrane lipoprotein-sorting protein
MRNALPLSVTSNPRSGHDQPRQKKYKSTHVMDLIGKQKLDGYAGLAMTTGGKDGHAAIKMSAHTFFTKAKKILFFILFFLPLHLDAVKPSEIQTVETKATDAEILKIINHWNGLHTICADILQTNNNGEQVHGRLRLKKGNGSKGKLRLDYQDSYKQRLVVKDGEVRILEMTDNSVSVYPVSVTPADLILKTNLKVGKDIFLIGSSKHQDEIQLILSRDKDETSATLTLFFSTKNGINLLRWKVLDPQGGITDVELISETVRLNDTSLVPDSIF